MKEYACVHNENGNLLLIFIHFNNIGSDKGVLSHAIEPLFKPVLIHRERGPVEFHSKCPRYLFWT